MPTLLPHARRAALVGSIIAACTTPEPPPASTVVPSPAPQATQPLPSTLAPVATEVALGIQARASIAVGESLDLELRVENHSNATITVVRPVYGSWEHARQPDYRLEWADERGEPILDPLGFAPGLECGVLDPIVDDDRIAVPVGATRTLGHAPAGRPRHEVLPSARPGRYTLRVRYLGLDVPGATPLHLLSAPIPVTIRDGDPRLWACRAQMLADAADYAYSEVTPAGVLPARDGGLWLYFSRYLHGVRGGVQSSSGDLQVQRLGPDLRPIGDATRLLESADEVGYVQVAPASDGAIVVYTPGAVGGRSIQDLRVEARGPSPTAGRPRVIQAAPGNPYVTRVARAGDRVAVLHDGRGDDKVPLVLTLLDDAGAPIGEPRVIAPSAIDFDLQAEGDGFVATWTQRGGHDGGVVQRLDHDGRAVGPAIQFPFDPSHSFAGVHHHGGELSIAYADAGFRGDDPGDRMGLYLQSFDGAGQARGRPAALSPESRTEAIFGVVAWKSGAALHAFVDGDTLKVGRGPGDARPVSPTAEERLVLAPFGDRLVLLWEDTRDDRSPACLQLQSCAPEVYGVALGPDGAPIGAPIRLTRGAKARPLLPPSHDWQRHCQ